MAYTTEKLLWMYRAACKERARAAWARGGTTMVFVATDGNARRYRKYDRLEHRLYDALKERVKDLDERIAEPGSLAYVRMSKRTELESAVIEASRSLEARRSEFKMADDIYLEACQGEDQPLKNVAYDSYESALRGLVTAEVTLREACLSMARAYTGVPQ